MTIRVRFDLLRDAASAHLHPELVSPVVGASASGDAIGLVPKVPVARFATRLLLLVSLMYVLGVTVVFAYDPARCPSGYVPGPPIWGVMSGPYDCLRVGVDGQAAEGRLSGGVDRREVGLYLRNVGLRLFDFDFAQGTMHFLGLAPPPN